MNQPVGTSTGVERHCGCSAHNHLQARNCLLDFTSCSHEIIDMPVDFLLPASGKECEHWSRVGQAERCARRFLVGKICSAIEKRMSNERRIDSVTAQKVFLEGENHSSLRNYLRKLR